MLRSEVYGYFKQINPMFTYERLTLMKNPIERVHMFKYLSVWFTNNLSWSYHIDKVTKKAIKQADLIYIYIHI